MDEKDKENKDIEIDDKSNESPEESEDGNYSLIGMCLGMGLGMIAGELLFKDSITGICIGMCLGLAIGSSIKKKK